MVQAAVIESPSSAPAPYTDWSTLEPQLQRLHDRPIGSVAELQRWILDWGDLAAGVDEERARRYVAMTGRTDDPRVEREYLEYVENLLPRVKPWWFRLQEQLLACPFVDALPARWTVFVRQARNEVAIFRPQNVPLQVDDEKLKLEYNQIASRQTVDWDGRTLTLDQVGKFLVEPDRALRQRAWEAISRRRLQDAEILDELYDRMIRVRHRIAGNAGFDNYRDYAFRDRGRFDYTPDDCARYRDAIAEIVVPAAHKLSARRCRRLGVDTLRPWDAIAPAAGSQPLRPFNGGAQLAELADRMFRRVHPEFGAHFASMRDDKLLDLESRTGKAPGGYQEVFQVARKPFIFMNSVGTQGDLEVMLHEGGHAFNTFECRDEPLYWYRSPPLEFAEVASMGMEFLGSEFLDEAYDEPARRRALREHLEGIVFFLPWMACVDAFQHWVYTNPEHTRPQRQEHWMGLMRRYARGEDWTGLDDVRAALWRRQLHIFEVPFYYIEYGIAQLGALQLWVNSRRDYPGTVAAYKRALALGGSRTLPELWSAAGIRFDFSAGMLAGLVDEILREVERLEP